MTTPPSLACRAVTKSYGSVLALRGVDLALAEPGFYAVMGKSGSGKSTLLHLLAALDAPDTGEIFIAGKPIHALSVREATVFRRTQIGIVFQQFNLIPSLTARENIELPGMLNGDSAASLAQRSAQLMDQLGIAHRAHHRPDALSGGEQQRVAIARALLYSPPVLFADEPTGNLDSASSAQLWGLLGDIARQQQTLVVMVTHEPAAAAYCSKIFILHDGMMRSTIDVDTPEGRLDAAGIAARYQQSFA